MSFNRNTIFSLLTWMSFPLVAAAQPVNVGNVSKIDRGAFAFPTSSSQKTAQQLLIELLKTSLLDPANFSLWINISNLQIETGDLSAAGEAAAKALAIAESNVERERALSQVGDVAISQGRMDEARNVYEKTLELSRARAITNSSDTQTKRDLSLSLTKMGELTIAERRFAQARVYFEEALTLRQYVLATNPTNAVYLRDMSVSIDRIGDLAVVQGRLEEGRKFYAESLALRRLLTATYPDSQPLKRDVSVSLDRLGDVAKSQGRLGDAFEAYAEGLAFAKSLVLADPTSAQAKRDLSLSVTKLGSVVDLSSKLASDSINNLVSSGAAPDAAVSSSIKAGEVFFQGRDISFATTGAASSSASDNSDNVRFNNAAQSGTAVNGAVVDASSSVVLNASRNTDVAASTIKAGQNATLVADGSVIIGSATATESQSNAFRNGKRNFVTSSANSSTATGSNVSAGGDPTIARGGAIGAQGSSLAAGRDVIGDGGIQIVASQNSTFETSNTRFSKKKTVSSTATSATNTLSAITAGSDTSIDSSGAIKVAGANITSTGETSLVGQTVDVTGVKDRSTLDTFTQVKKKTFSKKVTTTTSANVTETALASTIEGGTVRVGSVGDTTIKGSNIVLDRGASMTAGGDITVGTVVAESSQSDSTKVKKSGISVGFTGISAGVAVSVGVSKSKSSSQSIDQTVVGSQISGGDVNLTARGAGDKSTVTVTGSMVAATRDLTVTAPGAITFQSAQENDSSTSKNKSSGLTVGATIGAGGVTPSFSLYLGKRKSNGTSVTNLESVLSAGGTARVTTPGALTLEGAQLSGDTVKVNAGSLTITSQQDTANFKSKQTDLGLSADVGRSEAGASFGQSKQSGSFKSVQEQSGITAGKGGFDIDVAGRTQLNGAVIASTADPARNTLTTGELGTTTIENSEKFKASSVGLSTGLTDIGSDVNTAGGGSNGISTPLGTITGGLPSVKSASGSQSSTTNSAIAGGTINITSGDPASLGVAQTISRDASGANTPLAQKFDGAKRAEVAEAFVVAYPNYAREAYGEGVELLQELTLADPSNAQIKRDLSVAFEKLGTLAAAEGRLVEARLALEQGHLLRRELANANLGNAQAKRDESHILAKIEAVSTLQRIDQEIEKARGQLTLTESLTQTKLRNGRSLRRERNNFLKIANQLAQLKRERRNVFENSYSSIRHDSNYSISNNQNGFGFAVSNDSDATIYATDNFIKTSNVPYASGRFDDVQSEQAMILATQAFDSPSPISSKAVSAGSSSLANIRHKTFARVREVIDQNNIAEPFIEKLTNFESKLSDISRRMVSLENAIEDSPEKALNIPMIRSDIDNQKKLTEESIENMKESISKLYDLIIALVIAAVVGAIGVWVANYSRKSGV